MFQEVLKHYHYLFLNIIAMLLFMAVFAGIIVGMSRRTITESYRSLERLPLEDLPTNKIRIGKNDERSQERK